MLAEKNQDIKKAYDRLQIISKDEKARMLYEAREAERRDQISLMKSAKDEGKAEGKAEGKTEGKAEGKTEGKVEMAQDSIRQYLEARLGVESQVLQDSVRTITDLDTLSRIMKLILVGSPLDEVTALIRDNLVTQ